MIPIKYLVGSAVEPLGLGPKFLIHICNDTGGWGAGFVLALSKKWITPERVYRKSYMVDGLALGSIQEVPVEPGLTVINMVAQHRFPSIDRPCAVDYNALRICLRQVARSCKLNPLGPSVHMPRIGCGLAGGAWENVEPLILEELSSQDIPCFVYDLSGGT